MDLPRDLLCQRLIDDTRRAIEEKGPSLVRQAGLLIGIPGNMFWGSFAFSKKQQEVCVLGA